VIPGGKTNANFVT
ncbi:unnamed protein product, partial [Oikopleura dioica]